MLIDLARNFEHFAGEPGRQHPLSSISPQHPQLVHPPTRLLHNNLLCLCKQNTNSLSQSPSRHLSPPYSYFSKNPPRPVTYQHKSTSLNTACSKLVTSLSPAWITMMRAIPTTRQTLLLGWTRREENTIQRAILRGLLGFTERS